MGLKLRQSLTIHLRRGRLAPDNHCLWYGHPTSNQWLSQITKETRDSVVIIGVGKSYFSSPKAEEISHEVNTSMVKTVRNLCQASTNVIN